MTLYDLIFLGLLAALGFWGFAKGALRQVVNLLSFVVGIYSVIWSKGYLANTFKLSDNAGWVAAIILGLAVFVGLRYIGHALSDRVHKEKALGYVDRFVGFGVGVLWTLIIIGSFHLIFARITPSEKQPGWFVNAKIYPLSVRCADTIKAVLPKGTRMADKVAPEVEK